MAWYAKRSSSKLAARFKIWIGHRMAGGSTINIGCQQQADRTDRPDWKMADSQCIFAEWKTHRLKCHRNNHGIRGHLYSIGFERPGSPQMRHTCSQCRTIVGAGL